MARIEGTDLTELQGLLKRAESREATRRLMIAIAYEQGIPKADLADWYDLPLITVEEWISEFEQRSPARVFEDVERFDRPGRRVTPRGRQSSSRVEYVDYAAVKRRGWSVEDDDLFEKAADADLPLAEYGKFLVEAEESILEAAEKRGRDWDYACRGGACSNCAAILKDGEIAMPGNQILPDEVIERGTRLTCVGTPTTDVVRIVSNAKDLDFLDDYRLPAEGFQ